MSLTDDLQEPARAEFGTEGGSFDGVTSTSPITDWDDFIQRFGLDPQSFEVVEDTVRCSTWQQSRRTESGDRDVVNLYSYRGQIRRKRDALDIPALWEQARKKPRQIRKKHLSGRVMVVALADVQIGKTDLRGGTPELIDRVTEKLEKLDQLLFTKAPSSIVLADVGDLIEGFESGGDPHRTNDLSHPEQIELAATILHRFVTVCAEHAPTTVVSIPSNHTKWRKGKQSLGRPTDDYAISIHKTVQRFTPSATWIYPATEFDEFVTLDVDGTTLAVTHGHQYPPGAAFKWWAGMQHAGTALAKATVLLTGHYHAARIETDGRDMQGRPRWWIQAPTLDNGSAWYRNTGGGDSDPGLLTFELQDGLDLASLNIL
ncbi:hypothetical protein [Gulosibacter massiliensis]|uniref:hypothetical protein n=1 Tax=Gulosibacter massiliensis TaxID=2479839 RepID=UPI000F62FD2D|nr:hypothetical protein [Gulosibacter massiliensis]